jgi:orotate phosphoribosyltransferase
MGYFNILRIFADPSIIVPSVLIGCALVFLTLFLLRKQRTEFLVKDGLRMSKWFLVGGEESNFYYDIDHRSRTLDGIEKVSKWYIDNIEEIKKKEGIDCLAFIERDDGPVGALTKKDLISVRTNIPSFVVRPRRRILASAIKGVEGTLKGKRVAIISDVATTGQSITRVVEILQKWGAKVVGVITILNRGGADTERVFKNMGISFRFGAPADSVEAYVEH